MENTNIQAAAIIEFNDLHGIENVTIQIEPGAVWYECGRYKLHISDCRRVSWIKDNFVYHDDPSRPGSIQPCGTVGNWYGKKGQYKRSGPWEFTGVL